MNKTVKERVLKLRSVMKEEGMDVYVLPSADNHQSEYVENSLRQEPM